MAKTSQLLVSGDVISDIITVNGAMLTIGFKSVDDGFDGGSLSVEASLDDGVNWHFVPDLDFIDSDTGVKTLTLAVGTQIRVLCSDFSSNTKILFQTRS